MNLLQTWLLIGIPTLALGLAMFLGRSTWRPLVGYLVLLGGFAGMAVNHRASAGVFAAILVLAYAAGRGGDAEKQDHHPNEVGVPDEALHPSRRRKVEQPTG